MADLAALRAELRDLRKTHVKPVSKMRKGDISVELDKLRHMRETTPAVAAVPSAPPKTLKAAVETVKEAKQKMFPVKPAAATKAVKPPKGVAAPAKKDKITKAQLHAMLTEMSSDEECE